MELLDETEDEKQAVLAQIGVDNLFKSLGEKAADGYKDVAEKMLKQVQV